MIASTAYMPTVTAVEHSLPAAPTSPPRGRAESRPPTPLQEQNTAQNNSSVRRAPYVHKMADQISTRVAERVGVPGYPGPFAVGRYAGKLRDQVRQFARVCVIGEVTGARIGKGPNVYFELRDGDGALPCAMWRNDFDASGLGEDELRDGVELVAAGHCDFYPGSATSSPRFSFRVEELRLAGEGDLLARLARLRRQLAAEGLFEPQKLLSRPALPRRIGVVTAEGSAARRDLLAGLERRGWMGTIVWGYAPVQDRRAAPAIAAAIRDLAALGDVEAIVVTRGGGSIADLWAFCDETLCRTVALTPVPVISAVGHDVDRTLIDDVAAVCCSTPTHAAETVVSVDCARARERLHSGAKRIDSAGRAAVIQGARTLAVRSRAPLHHLERHRIKLHQITREIRAAVRRGRATRADYQRRIAASVIERKRAATLAEIRAARLSDAAATLDRAQAALGERRAEKLRAHGAALRAHDPERTLERGYALLVDEAGEPLITAAALRDAKNFEARLADGSVRATTRMEDR
jgi:exodeoxyribonuclease VII large subunit